MTAEPPHRTALTDIGFCIHAATEVIGHPQRQNLAVSGLSAFGCRLDMRTSRGGASATTGFDPKHGALTP